MKAEEYFKKAWDGELWEKGFKLIIPYGIGGWLPEGMRIALEMLAENLRKVNPKFQISILGMEFSAWYAKMEGEDPSPVPLNAWAQW